MASAPPASRTTTTFRVLVLGPFALERDGTPIDTSRWQRRVGSLFKLLATASDGRRRRDDVIDTLWPESAPEAGMGNLRIVTHRLRLAIGGGDPSPVIAEGGWIALNPAYTWDVDLHRFAGMVADANGDAVQLERALNLYRGEPLVEDRYDDWAVPIRESVQQTWRTAGLMLAAALEARGSHDDAAHRLERILESDPLDEEALRRLLEVLYAAGRRTDALRRYRLFEQRLADELGVPPSAETMAVVRRLHERFAEAPPERTGGPREPTLSTGGFLGALPEGPIVARGEEIERILAVADVTEERTGTVGDRMYSPRSGRLVLLRGERGAGKTRLAQEVMLRLRDLEYLVLTGRCYARERSTPLYPFLEVRHQIEAVAPPAVRPLLEQHGPWMSRVLPEEDSETENPKKAAAGVDERRIPSVERQRLFWVVSDVMAAIASERPLALLLDDLHNADDDTLDLLQHLARHASGHPLFLLGTYRDEEIGPDHPLSSMTRDLAREGLVERVSVPRLGLDGTAAMVEMIVGPMEASAEFADFVYRRTRGIPFYVNAMLQALGGHYCLIRQVGRGGMGRVFEAIDTRTGEQVAAKIMFARSEADPRALARFEQEAAVLARLDHPNVVKIHEAFLDEYANTITMEFLDGCSLRTVMRAEGLFRALDGSLSRIQHLTRQVVSALASAHDRGIVHRDIKPDNIMVTGDGHVKVTDFGIARLVRPRGDLTTMASTGMTIGTPLYMAPEQIQGRAVDGRADIYSLGAVLYEMVTGRPPFQADDPLTIAYRHVNESVTPPRELAPAVPDGWNALILKALAKDPAERFQTAAAMGEALASLETEWADIPPVPAAGAIEAGTAPRDGGRAPDDARAEERPRTHAPDPADRDRAEVANRVEAPGAAPPLADDVAASGGNRRRSKPSRRALAAALLAPLLIAAAIGLIVRTAGSPAPTPTRAPTPAESAGGSGPGQFEGPTGVSVDAHGMVYVVDQGNNRIQTFTPDGRPVGQYGSAGTGPDQFRTPTDVAVGPDGSIYVADYSNARIVVLTPTGAALTILSHWAARGRGPETFSSLAVDQQGNVYATDLFNDRVVELAGDGTWLSQWGRPGSGPGALHSPQGIAIDRSGDFFVADTGNNRVQAFSPSHRPIALFGGKGDTPGRVNTPEGLAVDRAGNVYVADTRNNRVQKFSPAGRVLATYGRFGSGPGEFKQPSAVAVDGQGNIYVADYYNNRLQKLSPSGKPLWASHGRFPGW